MKTLGVIGISALLAYSIFQLLAFVGPGKISMPMYEGTHKTN